MLLVSWDDVGRPKSFGGFCIYKIREFNLALITKQLWTLISSNSEWVCIFSSKYLCGVDHIRDLFASGFTHPCGSTL